MSDFIDNLQLKNTSKVIQNISNTIGNVLLVAVSDIGLSIANIFYIVGALVVLIGGSLIVM